MTPSILRLATSAALMVAAAAAYANPATTKDIEISGVLMEKAGPSARCPSQFGGTITGHGNSDQVGRVAFVATDCITPSGPLFNFDQGRFVILTTTGETIRASYSGQFVPTGVGAAYVFSGATFQITGGSGKYHKATGGGALTGGQDMITGLGTVKLSGKIHHKD